MSHSIVGLLLIQIVLIALNAVFASAELAVLSVNEGKIDRLAEQGNRKAKRLRNLTKEPAKFLSTIQIAITLSGFLGSAFAADGFSDPLVDWLIGLGVPLSRSVLDTLSVIFITLILSYFTLIFGELVPKRIAMKKSEALALGVSGVVSGISVLFKPIVWLLSISTNAVLRLLGIDPNEEDERICEEDIRMMVETGGETGAIDKEEQDFIQNVFEFDDLSAGEILTHRTDLVILWMEDTDDMWEEVICGSGFSRYPVCDGSPDQVIGILNAKVYLRQKDRSRENILKLAVEPAYFVPETIKADVLFRNMKQSHNAFAVVLDEYGGMTGIVTLSDLIEELVGEIRGKSLAISSWRRSKRRWVLILKCRMSTPSRVWYSITSREFRTTVRPISACNWGVCQCRSKKSESIRLSMPKSSETPLLWKKRYVDEGLLQTVR